MAKTSSDLATEVLLELRVIGEGETAEAEDVAIVKRKYSGLLEELRDDGKAFWSENSIPERVFQALARVVAGECANVFGKQYDSGSAFRRLITLAHRRSTAVPTRAEYF
jgi:hypothetical protein